MKIYLVAILLVIRAIFLNKNKLNEHIKLSIFI